MAVPKYDEMYRTFLLCLQDGQEHKLKDIVRFCGEYHHLTQEDWKLQTSSGIFLITNRVGWTRAYLKQAGLIENTGKGILKITSDGQEALKVPVIDNEYLMRFESFRDFMKRKKQTGGEPVMPGGGGDESLSPQERIDKAMEEINSALASELMDEILKIDSYQFEHLVIRLLVAMGYGSMLNKGTIVTPKSGDEGIDGVLTADKLGFDSIYIQAKQWKQGSVVGRPELQKFVGAMAGQGAVKGLFITTAKFTNEAIDYAQKNLTSKIVLVDGDALTKLMIEHDVGVYTVNTYSVKKVDTDFFSDFE